METSHETKSVGRNLAIVPKDVASAFKANIKPTEKPEPRQKAGLLKCLGFIGLGITTALTAGCGKEYKPVQAEGNLSKGALWGLYNQEYAGGISRDNDAWGNFSGDCYRLNGVKNFEELKQLERKQGYILIPDINGDGIGGKLTSE